MAFTTGLELVNNELAFAEHQNVELMGARGNQVVNGVGVTAQGTPDLTVAVASGTVLAGGIVVAVVGANVDFSTEQGALTSGQAQFGFVHVNSSGTIGKTMGNAAVAGQQLPADVPEDEVVLAQITLTEGDSTIDSVDIEDWRINVPKGDYIAGTQVIIQETSTTIPSHIRRFNAGIADGDLPTDFSVPYLQIGGGESRLNAYRGIGFGFHVEGSVDFPPAFIGWQEISNSGNTKGDLVFATRDVVTETLPTERLRIDTTGNIKNKVDSAGFYTGASDDFRMYFDGTSSYLTAVSTGHLIMDVGNQFIIQDKDDGGVDLFALNTGGRTLIIGASADTIASTFHGTVNFITNGSQVSLGDSSNVLNLITFSGARARVGYDGAGVELFATTGKGFKLYANGLVALSGDGTTRELKNQVDNAGFYTGASDDLRIYHDGTDNFILSGGTVSTIIDIAAGGGFIARLGSNMDIQDKDDSNERLFLFDTSGRQMVIGATDGNDDIAVSIFGTLFVSDGIGLDASVLTFATGSAGQATFGGNVHVTNGNFTTSATRFQMDDQLSLTTANSSAYGLSIGTSAAEVASIDEAIAEAWNLHSSVRWKTNIKPINNSLDLINKLEPVYYDLKDAKEPKHSGKIGFIAENFGKILPNFVNWEEEPDEDGITYATGMDYARLVALNMAGIKELHKLIREKLP